MSDENNTDQSQTEEQTEENKQEQQSSNEETEKKETQDSETQSKDTQEEAEAGQTKTQKTQTGDAQITKKQEEEAEAAAEKSSLQDYGEMIQKHIDGEITDEDYSKIEKAGLNREQFEIMAEGHKAMQEKNTAELYSYVGGEETYKELAEFGAQNLSQEEIDVYNDAINSNQPQIVKMAALGLKAMYEQENGNPPSDRVEGDGSTSHPTAAFSSQQEVIDALNDPRYGKDPEFTNSVNQRRQKTGY